ncbi:Threonine/homoserine efflux transporter RhtA [Tistlia consotensis]|uniref:Threonine/homoserine efflux transporter RhtA n=1 Tax=Tistlia consotensis USBA 355 TaxID=560819 RepID=A0A1Y6B841_9PROT|nr:DMT family transporter [Tistlia consotensis]SME93566.1 Threonine/homoserine efflux transporter RhtA [Tistlia consotensis USBA 355]SNR28709.1 Threonine/homoserine efflux transporter RhtA [Tistlia consotensis]
MSGDGRDGRLGYLLLASITLFWGVNWPAIKLSVGVLSVWDFRLLSAGVGGLGLLTIARLGRERLAVPRSQVGPLLLCALFNVVGWHLCSAFGVLLMPAGRAAILAFTMPLWASLFAVPILGERLTATRVYGLLLGLAGLAVLVGPDLVVFRTAPLGAGFMVLAAVSWGLGTVLLKRFRWTIATTTLAGWQQLAGALAIGLAGLAAGGLDPWPADIAPVNLAAIAYAVSVPMIYCFWAFMYTVRLLPAPVAAIGTLAVPVVGVFSGALLLGEPVGLREVGALLLICSALAVVLVLPAWRGRRA